MHLKCLLKSIVNKIVSPFVERKHLRETIVDLSNEITFHKHAHEMNRKVVSDLEKERNALKLELESVHSQNNRWAHDILMIQHKSDTFEDKYNELFKQFEKLADNNATLLVLGDKMANALPKLAKNKPLAEDWKKFSRMSY